MSTIGSSFGTGSPDPFAKPEAPLIADLQQELDTLATMVQDGQALDGTVDIGDLQQRIDATQDPELRAGLRAILDSLPRPSVATSYSSGCGGTSTSTSYSSGCSGTSSTTGASAPAAPPKMSRDDVQRVLAEISSARNRAALLDADGDGRLSFSEARQGTRTSTLESGLIGATLETYRAEVGQWAKALDAVGSSVDARVALDTQLTRAAHWHAKTPAGGEAIIAAYRDLLTQGGKLPDLDEVLWDAERGLGRLIRHLPIFGGKSDHLSDEEVEKLLGTDDLAAFTKDKNAAIEARIGGDYQNHYLAGKDLEGHQHLHDVDYKPFSSRCS